jgi:single-strand DNA-binding protein
MNETTMTLVGNAATEVRYRETPAGIPVASFRLATTVRRWDRERGSWSDVHTSFYTVWAWRGLAANVAGSVAKGDPLVVHGRVRVHEWEKDGRRHTSVEIEAGSIGHDLSRGTSAFRRSARGRPVVTMRQKSAEQGEVPQRREVVGAATAGPDGPPVEAAEGSAPVSAVVG